MPDSLPVAPEPRFMPANWPPFIPPRWLRNAHLQTVIASRMPRRFNYGWDKCEPVEIDLGPDGKLLAEASWQPGKVAESPLLFLLHGLEGSAQSHYLLGMSRKAHLTGFHTLRVNIRNCGDTEHLTPTLYCAGLSQDVLSIVRHCRDKLGVREIYAAGVSLGANMLLKFLGELGQEGVHYVRGAAVVSAPIDLELSVQKMEEPGNRFYQRYFVGKLVRRIRRKSVLFPHITDLRRVSRIRSIREFDDVVTAPHFGFGTAENYYRLASCAPLLHRISVPTLLIQSRDDPMIPFGPFVNSGIEGNPYLTLLATDRGGHTGFLAAHPSGIDPDAYWGEGRVVQFLTDLARSRENHP